MESFANVPVCGFTLKDTHAHTCGLEKMKFVHKYMTLNIESRLSKQENQTECVWAMR